MRAQLNISCRCDGIRHYCVQTLNLLHNLNIFHGIFSNARVASFMRDSTFFSSDVELEINSTYCLFESSLLYALASLADFFIGPLANRFAMPTITESNTAALRVPT